MAEISTKDRKTLETERGYQAGSAPVTEKGATRWVSGSLEPNPDLQGHEALRVWDEMARTDDQVGSALRALRTPVLGARWGLTAAADVDDDVVEFVRKSIGLPAAGEARARRNHEGIVLSDHLAEAFRCAVFGHAVFEQVYYYNPEDGRLHLRKLGARTQTTIEEIEVGADGGLAGIVQAPPPKAGNTGGQPKPVRIPVEQLVFYVVGKEGADWHGTSVLRSAYRPWFFKDRLDRLSAQIVERNGMGVPVITYEHGVDVEAVQAAVSEFRAGATAGVTLPAGADLKLLGVQGSTVDALPLMKHHAQQISKALAQGFQDLGHDAGARSLGETLLDVAYRAAQEVADVLADTFTEHVIRDLVELNWGPGTPYPVLSPGDLVTQRQHSHSVLVDLAGAGLVTPDDDLEAFTREQYGLPKADPAGRRKPPTAGLVGLSDGDDTPGRNTVAPGVFHVGGSGDSDLDRLEKLMDRVENHRSKGTHHEPGRSD